MEGKQYRAYVREKEIAKKEYEEAVASGVAAAHVHARFVHFLCDIYIINIHNNFSDYIYQILY